MRLQRFNRLLLASLLVLATCGLLSAAKASAVNVGTRLQQRPLYPASQGALSTNTNLTGVLPPTKFTIGKPQTVEAVGRCFDHEDTDECANLNSTWSVQQATYADNPGSSIYVCICNGAPFDARGLTSAYSHVSSCTLTSCRTSMVPESHTALHCGRVYTLIAPV